MNYHQKKRARVIQAREVQGIRYKENEGVYANAKMSTKQLEGFCKLNHESQQLLKMAMTKLNLLARAYDRILKVARRIANLEKNKSITSEHIAETIQYRSLNRKGWAG